MILFALNKRLIIAFCVDQILLSLIIMFIDDESDWYITDENSITSFLFLFLPTHYL